MFVNVCLVLFMYLIHFPLPASLPCQLKLNLKPNPQNSFNVEWAMTMVKSCRWAYSYRVTQKKLVCDSQAREDNRTPQESRPVLCRA